MLSPENEDEEFEFYLKFAKPLVLNLPDTNDRIKAATWIRYLKNDTTDPALRGEYLKLLLFVLQRRKLFGPFATIPDENKPLEKFPDEINIQDVAKNFVEVDKKVLKATLERGGFGEWPPYTTSCSSDLTEYASSQEIPNFGIQAYFAISRDPLQQWDHFERAVFPIGENIENAKPESSVTATASPDISCFVSPDHGEPIIPASPPRPKPRIPPGGPKSPPKGLADVSPKAPKDPCLIKGTDEFNMDPRVPPTWGSNLVNVKDSTSPSRQSPIKDLDIEVSDKDMLDFFNDDIDLFEADLDEASSYLQGDTLRSPPRAYPTSPMSPATTPSPAGTPTGREPSPQINIDDLYDAMSKYVDEDIQVIDARIPATTPQRSPSPKRPSTFTPGPSAIPPMQPCPMARSPPQPRSIIRPSPDQLYGALEQAAAGSGQPCPGQPCPAKQASSSGPSPTKPSLSPDNLFKALEHVASDKNIQDFYNTSLNIPDDDQFTSPARSPCADYGEKEKQVSPIKDVSTAVQEVLEEMNRPATSVLKTTGDFIEDTLMNKSGEGLGGDSFIAPDKKDYRWLGDMSGGPGLPQDQQQDPALWDSFGWWTDDPDEIFTYFPPSPRVYGTPKPDPYAAQRERWADVEKTPPIFSKDPKIREGFAAQRQYTIDEFGMESFEEPVWTSAEQYFKYKKESSPFIDPRQIDRKTLDPSQFPKYNSPKMTRQLADIHGAPEEEDFFSTQIAPDLINVSFGEKDFQKMTKVEAIMEAVRHGPRYIGVPTSTPKQTPEKDEGRWEDMKFIEETPPLFMLEPPFLATPPEYEPNPDINEDEMEDSFSKYIEEDLRIINAKIPVTTPQRSPSPKRIPQILKETPPFVPDTDVEPDPYIPSPGPTPRKYVVPAQKKVDWNTNIGSPIKFQKTDAVIIESEDELQERNIKRKQQLKLLYEQEFDSPPKVPTPPPMPHLMDEPTPRRLPPAIPPTKLPPPNWDWQTPPKYQREPYTAKRKTTPTGITPVRKIPEDISMYYESPPAEFLSPSMAVSSLMFSPPEGFGQGPSPVRSPGGTPVPQDCRQYDEIDMEALYPTQFQEFDSPELYQSPPKPASPSPEKKAWRDKVGAHQKTRFRNKTFVIRPKPGRSYRVIGSRKPSLGTLAETSPDIVQDEMEAEIAALEAELFPETPAREPRQRAPNDISPDYERKIWQESLKLHDPVPYLQDSTFNVVPSPVKSQQVSIKRRSQAPPLQTIYSPRSREFGEQQRQDQLRLQRHRARVQVEDDKLKIKAKSVDHYKYNKMIAGTHNPFLITTSYGRAMIKPKIDWPVSPPEEMMSPQSPPHIFDESVRQGPPSGWDWKTPPKLQRKPYVPKPKKTPTGISPDRPISQDISLFFESPPEESFSPSMAVGSLMYSPPEGFGKSPSPVRSPGGRPGPQDFGQYDEIDMEAMYPTDFDEFDSPEFYQSPERLSPEREAWRDRVSTHQKTPFRNKSFVIRPKPGRSYRVTGSKKPSLGTLVETSPRDPEKPLSPDVVQNELEAEFTALETEMFPETSARAQRQKAPDDIGPKGEKRIWQESIRLHDPVQYRKDRTVNVIPRPAKKVREQVSIKRKSQAPPLQTIYSPRSREFGEQQRQDQLRLIKHRAKVQVEDDKQKIKADSVNRYKYNRMLASLHDPFSKTSTYGRAMMRPKINIPRSPEAFVSPESPPHIFDESVRQGPPSGWDWKTPPKLQRKPYVPRSKKTPTGISPVRPVPQDISLFFESPPEESFSPSMAVGSLMYSPPEGFGKSPSPVRSPGGRPVPQDFGQYDEIDMEAMYPTDFDEFDSPELYQSPERLSPEREAWRDRVSTHERTPFRRKSFVVRPKPGRSYRVTRSKTPGLSTLDETSPEKRKQPQQIEAEMEAEIAALEAELFPETPAREPRQRSPNDISPDYERRMWQESLKLHDPAPYAQDSTFNVVPSPVKSQQVSIKRRSQAPPLQTIYSPRSREFGEQQRQDQLRLQRHRAKVQVEDDKLKIKAARVNHYKYNKIKASLHNPFLKTTSYGRAMIRPKIDWPVSPPEPFVSPPPPPHIFDEAVPAGQPPALLPPSGWTYKTPPQMKYRPPAQRKITTPTGISPVRLPPLGTLFYESPPMISPLPELSPPSPIRSPGGRPMAPTISPAEDDFDVASYCTSGYDILDEDDSPELYSSPEYNESVPSTIEEFLDEELATLEAEVFGESAKNGKEVLTPPRTPHATSPSTPEHLRRAWMQDLSLHENVPYRRKSFVVKPKPGKSYRITKSKQPNLTSVEEKYYEWSPPSPALKPRPPPEFPSDAPLPQVTAPPENWSWETPSPLTRRGLYTESPPLIYSPESPPEFSPTIQTITLSRTPTEESLSIFVIKKSQASSPLRSPGGRPVLQSLQDRPLDALEMAQVGPADYDLLTDESPELYYYSEPSPPPPPPMPRTPQPYYAQPRRIPGRRAPLDPNVLYASTPLTAARDYQPEVERIRFEQTRQVPMRPVTPPAPPKTYYETPIPPGTRPWKKRRKPIERTARRKLEFEDDDKEFEMEMLQELEAYLAAASPTADVLGESPPSVDYDLDEVSMLGDFDYEPAQFNMYADDIPQYDVRPAFEGQPDVDLMDTSMIESVDAIPYDQRDFRWMDQCGARCPWER